MWVSAGGLEALDQLSSCRIVPLATLALWKLRGTAAFWRGTQRLGSVENFSAITPSERWSLGYTLSQADIKEDKQVARGSNVY